MIVLRAKPSVEAVPESRATGAMEGFVARGMRTYLASISSTVRVTWFNAKGECASSPRAIEALLDPVDGSRVVATYWLRDCLSLALLPFSNVASREALMRICCLVDDTLGGRIVATFLESIGARHLLLPSPSDPERLRRVQHLILEGSSYMFPVDGGGPYRQVGTGIVGLAGMVKAVIVPMSFQASRAITFPHRSRFRIPLPGAHVAVGVGEPIRVDRGTDRRGAAGMLKAALDSLALTGRTRFA